MALPSSLGSTPAPSALRRPLLLFLALLVPVAYLAMRYDRYNVDGDAVSYMDIADLLHAHHWAGAVNAYWHPLYPAMLWLGQVLFHPATRYTELNAYYWINLLIFFAQVAAMLFFTTALYRLRERPAPRTVIEPAPLLSLNALRLLGLALIVISSQRELSMGRVRPDALLQALILTGLGALMSTLAANSARLPFLYPALMGLAFGLAYLAKSFAFVLAFLSVGILVLFAAFVQRQRLTRALVAGAVAFVVFAAVAGPYVAALSKQKHRLDFGDSGSLNYAWYVGGTEKMHLEPWMTNDFGSAEVHLIHPERQLLASPGVYSYKQLPYGTYPAWFDTTFFNDHIVPHMSVHGLIRRDSRNLALVFRYLLNHPEPLILLTVLLFAGARLRPGLRNRFWVVSVALGLAMWVLYGMVNVEERYVTVAYLAVVLPLFAALQISASASLEASRTRLLPASSLRPAASALVVLMAFLALGESLREALQERRDESVQSLTHGWSNPAIFDSAAALNAMGVRPGDEIACVGTTACLYDNYWARLAGVRVLTEIYKPDAEHLIEQLGATPNLAATYDVVRQQGARVLVGYFDPGDMNASHPASAGWVRLGETKLYALPLNLPGYPAPAGISGNEAAK